MLFGNLVDALAARIKEFDVATVKSNRDIAKLYLNQSHQWVYVSHRWEHRRKTSQIVLEPYYTTGSASGTAYNGSNENAARTVTFSGATLTTNMQGRYFQFDGSSNWQKIVYVDVANNTVYLDSPIIDTGSGTFKIWKRFYYLRGDVDYITSFGKWDNTWGRLTYRDFTSLTDRVVNVSDLGNTPLDFSPFGVDNYEPSYSTGTIIGAQDSNLITGNSTAFLANILPGDILTQGSNVFAVKRVESDTRLILHNYIPNAIPSGSAYEIKRNISLGFQFYPSTNQYLAIPYTFMDRVFDMVHETKDRTALPDRCDEAILSRAEYKLLKDKDNQKWVQVAQLYEAELDAIKKKVRVVETRNNIFAPVTRGYPGRM